jgi:zinc transporter
MGTPSVGSGGSADGADDGFRPFDEAAGLVFAVRLPGGAGALSRPCGFDSLPAGEGPLWVHLDRTREPAQRWLRERSGLDALVVDALLAEETRPRAAELPGGLLVILRGVNMNPGAEPDELISIRMWLEPGRAITVRQHRFQTVRALRQRAQRGEAPATTGLLLTAIAGGLAARLAPVPENLRDLVDEVEDRITADAERPQDARLLAEVRRQAIGLRRYVAPQRETLATLAVDAPEFIERRSRAELREIGERVARLVEDLEEIRDRASVTQDELRARREHRAQRTMYLLTLVAAIFLPLGLLTGLLGVNVGGIPGVDDPWAFWIVTGLLVAMAGVLLWAFRRMRWL